jgi:hypothetical protein
MSDEQTTFKVTDRRLFNADGTPRELLPEEKAETRTADPPVVIAEPASQPATEDQTEARSSRAAATRDGEEQAELDDPAGFANFIMSIASNAASALGIMEHPVTHRREVDIELGKHWIDVLGMLQQKTHGNLLPQEEQILEGLLADLRMQYVSLMNAGPQKASKTYSGRDIIGGR